VAEPRFTARDPCKDRTQPWVLTMLAPTAVDTGVSRRGGERYASELQGLAAIHANEETAG